MLDARCWMLDAGCLMLVKDPVSRIEHRASSGYLCALGAERLQISFMSNQNRDTIKERLKVDLDLHSALVKQGYMW
ncbi:MAG: hypothetical protein AB1797_08425 [bacterium]